MIAAVWGETNWIIVGLIGAGIGITVGAELAGVIAHDEHRLDTISEIWWSARNRLGPFSAVLAAALAAVLSWTFWHLSFEGRKRPSRGERRPTVAAVLRARESEELAKLSVTPRGWRPEDQNSPSDRPGAIPGSDPPSGPL